MTLRQTIQAAPEKAAALITKLSATSNQAIKTREGLFDELNGELTRYVEIEEQHFLPLLRKHSETKDLAVDALKGNKNLKAALEKLAGLPKDNDDFLAAVADLNKGFQQHVRNERKELLPAVLKVLTDEEAATLAADMESAVEEAKKAERDERAQAKRDAEEAEQAAAHQRAAARKAKRDERAEAERQAEEAKKAAAAERAVARAKKEAEQTAREASEKVTAVMEDGTTAVQDRARQITETLTERTQKVASDTLEALTIYSDAARKMAADMQVVTGSSTAAAQAVSEVTSAWTDWFSKATRANAEASQKLFGARSVKDIAEVQRELATNAMHNWMERRTAMFRIAQRSSEQALTPLQARVTEAA